MFHRSIVCLAVLASLSAMAAGTAAFPEPYDSEKGKQPPMSAEASARSMRVPDGFGVTVVASEPDVRQPVAMAFDLRGRLWVAENYTYAEAGVNFATNLMDRILILEDADGDGRAERRKVFWDQAQILTSVEPVPGGVYVLCPPRLLFIADANRDDVPDGPPEVVLDGFATTTGNRHTFANGLKWGPDGWLWGRIGISSGAKIGLPGQAESERVEMRGGIWRFHPKRRVVEAVSHGTTNPWGLDWNEVGEPFFINTVIGHLWHAVSGAHLERMHGNDVLPRAYALMPQIADHSHFDTGAGWTKSRPSADGAAASGSDELGGGHAHAALMIYQGTNWPASYRGGLFTWNLHGRRANRERLERVGSGYVGRHEPDLFQTGDPWFRGIEMLQGPEGAVYVADWSDTGECHEHDGVHRSSGRIHRIQYGTPPAATVPDLEGATMESLEQRILDPNEWTSRAALKVLATRSEDPERWESSTRLRAAFQREKSGPRALRVMWALNALGTWTPDWMLSRTGDDDEHVRSWAVRLLADQFAVNPDASAARSSLAPEVQERVFQRWERMAARDTSGLVRLYLASALQRMPADRRGAVAQALAGRTEDSGDRTLGLMIWYGIEPLGNVAAGSLRRVAESSAHPVVRRFVSRRLAEDVVAGAPELERLLAWAHGASEEARVDVLAGMSDALRGTRRAPEPKGWAALGTVIRAGANEALKAMARDLDVVFGDGRAADQLRKLVEDGNADALARKSALRSLLDAKVPDLGPVLRRLAGDGSLRATALAGLLEISDPQALDRVFSQYIWVGLEERPTVILAMVARVETARALLQAIADGRIQRSDLTAFQAGQIARLGDASLTALLEKVWGTVRTTPAEKRQRIEALRRDLGPAALAKAQLGRGRQVFVQACAGCHRLYGEGGEVGPDLTGSGRADLGYLLENVVDPGAVVAAEQRLSVVTLKDGRVVSGLLRDANERTLTVVNPGERLTVSRAEVMTVETMTDSAMPEGLLDSMPPTDVRDLIAYLMHSRQVPLPQ
jgi:putative membrane-bound dehydrogenase-like protein